jgi:PucR family transcriptional regulator, purine catabolism regulatory protein
VKRTVGGARRAVSKSDEPVAAHCPNRPITSHGDDMGVLHVGELLSLPVLRGARVVAGHRGLDREVTNINVMEVPDIEAYVHPGEVLLTTLYPLRDDLAGVTGLIRRLHDATLSALVVRLGRYVDHLPAAALDTADELGFPIVVVDTHIAFNDVIAAVLAIVLADYGPEPGRAETIRERLTAVALTGGGLAEIARTLAGALNRHVVVVDAGGATLGTGQPATEPRDPARPAADPSWAFPITVAGTERGRLLVDGSTEPTLGQRRLIRQACFAAGMHIAQALASVELDRRMRVLLLEEAVTGSSLDHGQLLERSRLFGWDFTVPHAVVLARGARELADADVARTAAAALPGAPAWSRGIEAVAIVPMAGVDRIAELTTRVQRWRTALAAAARCAVHAAIGPVARDADGLAASHRSARESLAIGEVTARPLVRNDELLLERLLLSVDPARLRELVRDQIGPLIEADRTGSGTLCETLETYLGIGNAAAAARLLYIHYNTMKHRLVRIVELLGVDLHDPRTRLSLAVALAARALTSGAGSGTRN